MQHHPPRVVMALTLALAAALYWAGCAKSSGSDCGNGQIDGAEECDGADLSAPDCAFLNLGQGPLKCNPDCTLDTRACTGNAVCGNNVVEGAEYCDGPDLGGQSCATLNLGSGALGCLGDCTFDTSGCDTNSVCGNGVVEGLEDCDGFNLNGQSCATQGFSSGQLSCNTGDCTFDTSLCTTTGPVCGDGVREGTEQCDGADLAGYTCVALGHAGGVLGCTAACTFDESGCGTVAEICDNLLDDDGDGQTDCDDPDCFGTTACGGPEICTNGLDDDGDTLIDCDDVVDCSGDPACQTTGEDCFNGVDDDGAWGCDCNDVACFMDPICIASLLLGEFDCTDGVDDDFDCDIDCADSDCASDPACQGPICASGPSINCGDSVSDTTVGGANNFDDWISWCPSGYTATGPEDYYVFTPAGSGSVTIELSIPGGEDLELLFVGDSGGDCDPAGSCIDGSQTTTSPETLNVTVTGGTTYYIIIDGWQGAAAPYNLSVTCS